MLDRNSFINLLFRELIKQSDKRKEIIELSDKKTTKYFAIRSIVFSAFSAAGIFAAILLFTKGIVTNNIAGLLFMIIFAIALGISSLLTFIISIITIINQFRMNRGISGFIALIVFIVLLVGSVYLSFKLV